MDDSTLPQPTFQGNNNPATIAETAQLIPPIWEVQLIRQPNDNPHRPKITTAEQAYHILQPYLSHKDREHFLVLMLDLNGRLIGLNTVAIGSLHQAIVTPRETFKPAILSNATAIIVAHNHPSDNLTPSEQDEQLTRNLIFIGHVLGIELLDHLIIGSGGQYLSLRAVDLENKKPLA